LDGGVYSKANASIDKLLVNIDNDNSIVTLVEKMPADRNAQSYEVTWLIRRLFRAMAARAEQYLADAKLTAADRAVMEFLYPETLMSVPQIARRYQVSRQHIQATVNALLDKGLLRSVENPRHKRSRLIRLSNLGRECFEDIRHNEGEEIAELFAGISDQSLTTTRTTLNALLNQFH
jgi:DNA-binding MarR family transcriptional regulator